MSAQLPPSPSHRAVAYHLRRLREAHGRMHQDIAERVAAAAQRHQEQAAPPPKEPSP